MSMSTLSDARATLASDAREFVAWDCAWRTPTLAHPAMPWRADGLGDAAARLSNAARASSMDDIRATIRYAMSALPADSAGRVRLAQRLSDLDGPRVECPTCQGRGYVGMGVRGDPSRTCPVCQSLGTVPSDAPTAREVR